MPGRFVRKRRRQEPVEGVHHDHFMREGMSLVILNSWRDDLTQPRPTIPIQDEFRIMLGHSHSYPTLIIAESYRRKLAGDHMEHAYLINIVVLSVARRFSDQISGWYHI